MAAFALLLLFHVNPALAGFSAQPVEVDTLFNCTWSPSTTYPIAILDAPTTTVGGFLYSFAGVSTTIVGNSYKFDGTTWTPIANLPVALEFAGAVNDGASCYILGGAEPTAGTPQTTVYRYNVASNTYTTLAPFNTGVWNPACVYLNGKIYKFCGTGPATASTNVVEIYDVASNTWSSGPTYPLLMSFVSGWTDGTYIYGAGGLQSVGSAASAKTYRLDPANLGAGWNDAAIADLPATRWGAATAFYAPDVVLAGGYVSGAATANISSTAISYDLASNTWMTLPNMVGERARFTGAVLNGSLYAVGGRSIASPAFVGTNSNQKLLCLNVPTNILSDAGSMIISAGANGVLDPGETVTVSFGVQNTGGPGVVCTTAALTGTLQASGGVTMPSAPQNYGIVCSPPSPTSRSFTFTVAPALPCGATVTASLQMQDGATNYGTLTYTFVTGTPMLVFAQNWDGVVAPALPSGWTPAATGGELPWVTSTTTPFCGPNQAFAPDPSNIGNTELISPPLAVPASGARLTFRNSFDTEATFDGMALEISINGGAFTDIITAGGTFVSGQYTGPISTAFGSPIAGRNAWSGNSGGYIMSVVNLPPAANGQNVQLKWRMASDDGVAAAGVMIDDISISFPVCGMIPQFISGIKHVGTGGDYPTLTAAVNDLNHKVLDGPLAFVLIDSSYTTGPEATGESFPIVIEQNSGASGMNTVTIKPGPPVNTSSGAKLPSAPLQPVSITGSSATALIVFNGTTWTSIDGSAVPDGSDRSLTLTNTNPGTSSAVVWMQTTTPGSIAAANNTVKNVNLVGNSNTTTLFGVGSGGSTISVTSLGGGNNNNTFQNNSISGTQYGIYSQGASAANKNTGTVITQNLINAASPNNVQIGGIMVGFEDNIAITQNVVSGMSRPQSAFGIGVGFVSSSFSPSVFTGNEVTNATISRNNIGAVTSTGSFSATGIALASAASGTSQISNNFVSGVTANSTSGNFSAGLLVGGGTGSTTQIYANSVSMTGARGAASGASYALAVGGSNNAADARDNILFNSQTSASAGKSYAIGLAYSTYSNLISDYNDLFASGTQTVLAVVGSLVPGGGIDLDTLSAWQAATGKDDHSISANPLFLSAMNLHITPISPAAARGIPIAAITNDIDGNPRSSTAPDIGADESTLKILSIARAGNGHIILQCLGVPNQVNNLQVSPDLSPMSFMTLIPAPPAADGLGAFQYDDAGAVGLTKRFYRLGFP